MPCPCCEASAGQLEKWGRALCWNHARRRPGCPSQDIARDWSWEWYVLQDARLASGSCPRPAAVRCVAFCLRCQHVCAQFVFQAPPWQRFSLPGNGARQLSCSTWTCTSWSAMPSCKHMLMKVTEMARLSECSCLRADSPLLTIQHMASFSRVCNWFWAHVCHDAPALASLGFLLGASFAGSK